MKFHEFENPDGGAHNFEKLKNVNISATD